MATLTIRNLDDDIKDRLRMLAATERRSMEEQARRILTAWLTGDPGPGGPASATEPLGTRMHSFFAALDHPGLDPVERTERPRQVSLPVESVRGRERA